MSRLKGQVAVITGASGGIGRAVADRLARKGAVTVLVARRAEALAECASQCRSHGTDSVAMPADVRHPDSLDEVAREAAGRFGRIDIWINNAGVMLFAPVDEAPVELWHRVIETNLYGTYHGIRAALPIMREQGEGSIVNVSSVLGCLGSRYLSSYVASKYGVRGLSDSTRQEVADIPGIGVTTVDPGPVDTPIFASAANMTGWRIQPFKPVIDARRVARVITSCAARPRREVVVGAMPSVATTAARIAPGLTGRVAARRTATGHFSDELARQGEGNLIRPTAQKPDVSGGWTRMARPVADDRASAVSNGSRSGAAVGVAAAAAAATAAAVATAGALRRQLR